MRRKGAEAPDITLKALSAQTALEEDLFYEL